MSEAKETAKLDKRLYVVESTKCYPEYSVQDKCCFVRVPMFSEEAPWSEGYSAYSLDELFHFTDGKLYRITVEEL